MREASKEEMERHIAETLEHVYEVRALLRYFTTELTKRGEVHDKSKLEEPEAELFAMHLSKLKGVTYGTAEYRGILKEIEPAIKHHYENNRHHVEHFDLGIRQMNLLDLVEMFCDWVAATNRHADGDIFKSIIYNKEYGKITPEIADIFRNTAKALGLKEK